MAEKPAEEEEDMEAEKENVVAVEEPPPPVKLQFCTFPPLTPENEAMVKMVDLQKMGRSHKILPVAPDGFVPNSEVRKLYKPIDSSQQLVPIGATPVDIEAILKKQTVVRTVSEERQLSKTLQHYMADEKMREVSFADAVVDATDTTAALAQRINSDEIRRDILDTFYENLDKEYGSVKMSSVAKRRPKIDGKDLRAEKRAKLLQEKRRKLAEAASTLKKKDAEESVKVGGGGEESPSEGSSVITGREDTIEATFTSDVGELELDQFVPLEDDLDKLPFEERMMKMFEMLVAELGSADAVYHMASRVLEEDPKAWYHMKMALSKNDRIRYFVDGLRQPRFACDFLVSMFGSIVKMMDTLEGALDGTIEDTRLLRLMLNSQEKTDTLLSEFGKARTLAQVILTEILPPNKNTHYLLRDALRCYAGAVEMLASYIDDDIRLTEKLLRFVMTSNVKGLLDIRPMVVSKGRISRARMEEEAANLAASTMTPTAPTPASDGLSATHTEGSDQVVQVEIPGAEVTSQTEKKPKDRGADRMRRKTKTIRRKLPPLPKFSEAAWKAHLANRLNAAIEVCAETAAMKQVAVALKLDDQQDLDESTQANAQGLIMSVFESRMIALQTICDALGCRMSSEALLNSALNMQRETLNAFLNAFETKETGLRMLEVLLQAKNNAIESLQLGTATDDVAQWQPIEGIDRMLRFPVVLKENMMAEVKKLKEKGLKIDPHEVLKCLETLLTMDEGTVNAINDCLIANRHPLAFNTARMLRVDSLRLSGQLTDQLCGVITSNRKPIIKILASSFDSVHRTEREQKASQQIDQMTVKFDKDIMTDFLQCMASRFDTMQLLHRLERDRNKVLDFVRAQGPQRDLLQVYEAMDRVESLLQKAQRMTKVTIRLNEETASVVTLSEEGDECLLKTNIHKILKELHKVGIEMSMAMFDDAANPESYQRLFEVLEPMPIENGLQGLLEFMCSDEFKERTDETAQPLLNEMASTLRHMTRNATKEEVGLVKKCVLMQVQRMIVRAVHRQEPTSDDQFANNTDTLGVYKKLKDIVCRADSKKAVMRALKEFLQTDEFKAVFNDMEMLLAHLIKKVENLPHNMVQVIRSAVADHKATRKKQKKDETSSQKKKEGRGATLRPSFASRLPATVAAEAKVVEKRPLSPPKPVEKEEKEESEVKENFQEESDEEVKRLEEEEEKEKAKARAREKEKEKKEEKKDDDDEEDEEARRIRSEEEIKEIMRAASSTRISSDEASSSDEMQDKQLETVPATPEEAAAMEEKKKKKLLARVEMKKKKKRHAETKGSEDKPYFEPLEIAAVDVTWSTKQEERSSRPSLKKSKKPGRAGKTDTKEEVASEVKKTATIDLYSKDELRETMRDMHVSAEKMRRKDEEQKAKARKMKKAEGTERTAKDKELLRELLGKKEPEPEQKEDRKLKPAAEIWTPDEEERSAFQEAMLYDTFAEMDMDEEEGMQLGMIGDLHWDSLMADSVDVPTIVQGEGMTTEDGQTPEVVIFLGEKAKAEDEDAIEVELHEKVDGMPREKEAVTTRPAVTSEATPEPDLPGEDEIESLRQVGLTPKSEQDRIMRVLNDIISQTWFKAARKEIKGRPVTINNVCRMLCEMLNMVKKADVFNSICQALETINEKIELPEKVVASIVKFLESMITSVTKVQLPELVRELHRTKNSKLDRITQLRKQQLTQERGRETYSRTLRVMQSLETLGHETRATKLELRRHFLSLFPVPAMQQADVDKMTDEELESFLKPPETVSHEMRPPTLGEKVVSIAKATKRTGDVFGREADAYVGGISGGGGGGGGGGGASDMQTMSPFAVPLAGSQSTDLAMLPKTGSTMDRPSVSGEMKHFTPQESRVQRKQVDMERDDGMETYDAEDVAKKEMELQRSLFLFSDEKPFKTIVAESDLPLHDLAMLHIEEEKKKLRVVDVSRAQGKFMEEDYAYGQVIRKLPDMQLSPEEQTRTEKLLPGEELDYGERRVISLCKTKEDRKPKRSMVERTKTDQSAEQTGGAKKVVHPIEQLQAKKDKKHKARKERPATPGTEEEKKERERVRTIGALAEEQALSREEKQRRREAELQREAARSEAEGRAKEVLRASPSAGGAISPPGARVDVTPVSSPTSGKEETAEKDTTESPPEPTRTRTTEVTGEVSRARSITPVIKEQMPQAEEEEAPQRMLKEGGGIRRPPTPDSVDILAVVDTKDTLPQHDSALAEGTLRKEASATLLEEDREEEELEKILDDEVGLDVDTLSQEKGLDAEERAILRRLRAGKSLQKRISTQDAQKTPMSLKARDMMERLIYKKSEDASLSKAMMVQSALTRTESMLITDETAETARIIAARGSRFSSQVLRQSKRSVVMPHTAVLAMVSGKAASAVDTAEPGKMARSQTIERKSSCYLKRMDTTMQAQVKAKAVQEDSRLLKAMRAIPKMQKDYQPNFAVLSRLPDYLKPEAGGAKELSKIAAIAVDRIERPEPKGLGGQPALITAVPPYSDPMFHPPSPVSLPFLPDPLSAEDATSRAKDSDAAQAAPSQAPRRAPVVPPAPPCLRPSFVSARDWGRISISREAWRAGNYVFSQNPAPGRHCMFDELCATNAQDYGVQVGRHLVRCDLVKMISASIHETARKRIEKRLVKTRALHGGSSIGASTRR